MSEKKDQRKYRRRNIALPVLYQIKDPYLRKILNIRGRTDDLSKGGLSLVASHIPKKPVMTLKIELPHQKGKKPRYINAKVNLVYNKPISDEDTDIFRTGMCFIKLSKRDIRLLNEIIDSP